MVGQRPSTPLPRRDRNNRDHFAPHHFDIYGRGFDGYINDFTLDPCTGPFINGRFISSFEPHRPFVTRRVTEIGRSPWPDAMDQRLGSTVHIRDALPFGRAMRGLHEQAARAEQFYGTFQSEYDGEIAPIKKYATEDILTSLWRLRVSGRRDPKTVLDGEDKDDDEDLQETKGQFEDVKRDLARGLSIAIHSSMKDYGGNSTKATTRLDNAKRLQRKVDTTNDQILDLLSMAKKGREYCVALLSELDYLKTLIDPEVEKNKVLYKYGGNDAEDNASMACNDGWED